MNPPNLALTLIKWVFWPLMNFCSSRPILGPGGLKRSKRKIIGKINLVSCLWRVFQNFFEMFSGINLKVGPYTQWVAQHIEFTFHPNGVPVTYFMFLAQAQLTKAFTDAGKRAYYAASDWSCSAHIRNTLILITAHHIQQLSTCYQLK